MDYKKVRNYCIKFFRLVELNYWLLKFNEVIFVKDFWKIVRFFEGKWIIIKIGLIKDSFGVIYLDDILKVNVLNLFFVNVGKFFLKLI